MKLRRIAGASIAAVAVLGTVASFLPRHQLTPLEQFVKPEQTAYDTAKAEYARTERTLVFRKIEWYVAKLQTGEALTPEEAADYARLQERSRQVEGSLVPVAKAASWRFSDDAALKLDAYFASIGSPLAGNSAAILWAAEVHDVDQAALWIGMMKSESHYCTHFARPAVEPDYHNCSGLKSAEIIRTGRPDANGSYLRKFDTYADYFNTTAELWNRVYDDMTPAAIRNRWVGHASAGWLQTANAEAAKIAALIYPPSPTT